MSSNIVGVVSSVSSKNTIVVSVDRSKRHPIYKKEYSVRSKFYAHDAKETAKVGDTVELKAIPPKSKTKRWELVKVLEKAEGK